MIYALIYKDEFPRKPDVASVLRFMASPNIPRHEMPASPSIDLLISIEPTMQRIVQEKCFSLNRISLS